MRIELVRAVLACLASLVTLHAGAELAETTTDSFTSLAITGKEPAPGSTPLPSQAQLMTPRPSSSLLPAKTPVKANRRATPAASKGTPVKESLVSATQSQRSSFDEARRLLVPNQNYLLNFEDEGGFGKVAESGKTHLEHTFTESEVQDYREAVEKIGQYRNAVRSHCTGSSNRVFLESIDRYFNGLASFNRKGLPLVADISENNNSMVLIINQSVLVDAPILISRYLRFKKQRFKESIDRFDGSDAELTNSLITIARLLKVTISEADWNKNYGIRENGLEMISMWPRESIFMATERLADTKETVCIVDLKAGTTPAINASTSSRILAE